MGFAKRGREPEFSITSGVIRGSAAGPSPLGFVGALGVALAGLPILAMFAGFSVDDARIVARVAEHGRSEGCFCFNPPQFTDAVTPLGYAQLVAFFMRVTDEPALLVQSVLGYAAWALTALLVGAMATDRQRPWLAGLLAVNLPLAAWAGAGLETSIVTLFVTLGALLVDHRRTSSGAFVLGCAAAWRPELLVFGAVAVFTMGRAVLAERPIQWRAQVRLGQSLVLFGAPVALVVLLRALWFDAPWPLSFRAKEPAFDVGLTYAVFALLGSGAPLLALLIYRGPWRLPIAAHFVALALAGGDWMPLYRLAVPVIPLSAFVASRALALPTKVTPWARVVGIGAVALGALLLGARFHARAPGVRAREEALIAEVKPWLAELDRVATVDVGWVGATTTGEVIDLAGVVDPRVAVLPGGHTSRPITPGFFAVRGVDAWLFRATVESAPARSLEDVRAVYVVDERLRRKSADLGFELARTFTRPGTGEVYVLARYRSEADAR